MPSKPHRCRGASRQRSVSIWSRLPNPPRRSPSVGARKRAVATFGEEGYSRFTRATCGATRSSRRAIPSGMDRSATCSASPWITRGSDFLALDGVQSGASAGEAYRRRLQHKVADLYSVEGSLAILCSYNYSPLEGSHRSLLCLQAPLSEVERNAGAPGGLCARTSTPGSLLILHGWERAPASGARPVDLVAPSQRVREARAREPQCRRVGKMPGGWQPLGAPGSSPARGTRQAARSPISGQATSRARECCTRCVCGIPMWAPQASPSALRQRASRLAAWSPLVASPLNSPQVSRPACPSYALSCCANGERVQVTDVDHADSAEVAYLTREIPTPPMPTRCACCARTAPSAGPRLSG